MADDRARTDGSRVNVGDAERWVSGILGAALIGYGLSRGRLRGVLVPIGLGLVGRAVTGRSRVNRALGRNSARGERRSPVASLEAGEGTRLEQTVVIARPREELFQFWRRFDNLPRFMDNLQSVTVLDGRRSHWVAKGPLGALVEWDAEIHNEIRDELIAWRSLPGSDVDQAGSVHFMPGHGGGTEVRVVLRYATPAGRVGEAIGQVLGEDPGRQIADDLRRLKQVMEAGEVPTP
ncbi:MAG: SRPBCC family protein [Gemmatimonadales bacterium]